MTNSHELPAAYSPFRKDTATRLAQTDAGRALKTLIESHGFGGLAEALSVPRALIRHWVHNGKVGKAGARSIEERMGIKKETVRPDVKPEDWDKGDRGLKPASAPRVGVRHAPLIDALVRDLGVDRAGLGKYLCVDVRAINQWRSRDKIPQWALKVLAEDETVPLSKNARVQVRLELEQE